MLHEYFSRQAYPGNLIAEGDHLYFGLYRSAMTLFEFEPTCRPRAEWQTGQKRSAICGRFGILARFTWGLSNPAPSAAVGRQAQAVPANIVLAEAPSGAAGPLRGRFFRPCGLPQAIEEFQLALEVGTKQYLPISFSPKLRRRGIPAVLGQRLADAIDSLGSFRSAAKTRVFLRCFARVFPLNGVFPPTKLFHRVLYRYGSR
jgi:hypothetical protein